LGRAGPKSLSADRFEPSRAAERRQDSCKQELVNREDTGNANPDNNVRFDLTIGTSGGYIYNLSTKGLTQGVYSLGFYVGADHTFLYDLSLEIK